MLTVIIGGTSDERLTARHKVAGKVALEELEADRASVGELAALAGTPALWGGAQAYLLRGVFGSSKVSSGGEEEEREEDQGSKIKDQEESTDLLDVAQGLVESPHIFIVEEEKMLASKIAKLTKAGANVASFEKAEKKEAFNVFALADVMAQADKKKMWLLLMQALAQGIAPENIAGILAWKARTMLAGARTPTERARYHALSLSLVTMYHDSHRGAGDLALLLEKFALGM